MGNIGYNDWSNSGRKFDSAPSDKITFFSVKQDGEATVRFVYDDVSDIQITATHLIKTPSLKYGRYVDCFKKDASAPIDDCPLCKAGFEVSNRFYVKLVEYVKNSDGTISALPKIWDRSAGYANTIANLIREYGSLKDIVFKIKRTGTGLATEYSTLYGAPNVYKEENYPKNFKAFDGFDASKFIHRSEEDINEFLKTGELPAYKKNSEKKDEYKNEDVQPKITQTQEKYAVNKETDYANPIPMNSPRAWGSSAAGSSSENTNGNNNNGIRPNRYY